MSTRTRPMAVDGYSVEAEPTPERISEVQVVVLDILRVAGVLTDDALITIYQSRVEHYPGVPAASPQSIRSRRAELVRKGLVRTAGHGISAYGRRATVWALNIPKAA